MNTPDFLVVGTARAGTTSIYSYLLQHPQLFLPVVKEPCFFTFAGEKINYKRGKFSFAITAIDEYSKLFEKASPRQLTGECSTSYLYLYNKTIANIKKFRNDYSSVKIIIVLRNPVDRAYSQYLWRVRDGREDLTFEEAISQEAKRMKDNYSFDYFYLDRGKYYSQVKAYLQEFKDVKIILYEDLKINIEKELRDICQFLKVEKDFIFVRRTEQNSSFLPKSKLLSKLISFESKTKFRMLNYLPVNVKSTMKEQFRKFNSSSDPVKPLSIDLRNKLNEYFKDDIQKLEKLIERDLSLWQK